MFEEIQFLHAILWWLRLSHVWRALAIIRLEMFDEVTLWISELFPGCWFNVVRVNANEC